MLSGFGTGLWVVERYLELKELAVGIALISVSFILLGTLTIYTAMIMYLLQELVLSTMANRLSGPLPQDSK